MTDQLTHDRAAEELEAVALGIAPPDIVTGVGEHAAACDECRRALDAHQQTVAALGYLAPVGELNRGRSAGIRSRLVSRAGADADLAARRRSAAASRPVTPPRPGAASRPAQPPHVPSPLKALVSKAVSPPKTAPPPRDAVAERPVRPTPVVIRQTPVRQTPVRQTPVRQTPVRQTPSAGAALAAPPPGVLRVRPTADRRWAVAATIGLLAVTALLVRASAERNALRSLAAGETSTLQARADSLEQELRQKERALAVVSTPGVRIVSLTNRSNPGRALARMFWDAGTDRWTLFVYQLRQPRPGRIYQVWLVTRERRISAGLFRPNPDGGALVEARHDVDPPRTLRAVVITEEPVSGSDIPSGPVVLAGGAAF
jgi:hypothetical protein